MSKEEQARQLNEAFAQLAADQVRDMSDEELARHAEATVAMLDAIKSEYARRNALKAGKPSVPPRPVGTA